MAKPLKIEARQSISLMTPDAQQHMHAQTGADCAHHIEKRMRKESTTRRKEHRAVSATAHRSLHGVERERASTRTAQGQSVDEEVSRTPKPHTVPD